MQSGHECSAVLGKKAEARTVPVPLSGHWCATCRHSSIQQQKRGKHTRSEERRQHKRRMHTAQAKKADSTSEERRQHNEERRQHKRGTHAP